MTRHETVIGHETPEERELLKRAEAATRERPGDPDAWVSLGRLLFEPAHRHPEALRAFEKALSLRPDDVAARFWMAAVYFHEYADSERAARILEEATRLDPANAESLSLLASARRDVGADPREVIDIVARAVAQQPSWRTPRELLTTAYLDAGLLDDARNELSTIDHLPVIERPTDPADAYFEEVVTGRAHRSLDIWRQYVLSRLGRQSRRTET